MACSDGKEWESTFKKLAEEAGCNCIRLYDVTLGYKDVDNPADFIISKGRDSPSILIECKSCEKSSFALSKFPQLDRLLELPLFESYVVIWFIEYKRIIAINTLEVEEMRKNGYKSINPNKLGNIEYVREIDLATVFKRINPQKLEVSRLWKKER